MKKKSIILIVIAIVIVIFIVYLIYVHFKNPATATAINKPPISIFPLHFGSNGREVMQLQNYFLAKDPTLLPRFGADGSWGSETEAAAMQVLGVNSVSQAMYNQLGLS